MWRPPFGWRSRRCASGGGVGMCHGCAVPVQQPWLRRGGAVQGGHGLRDGHQWSHARGSKRLPFYPCAHVGVPRTVQTQAFFVAALCEEWAKLRLARRALHFEGTTTPTALLLHAAAASHAFASLENVFYLNFRAADAHGSVPLAELFTRCVLVVPSHVTWGVAFAAGLAMHHFGELLPVPGATVATPPLSWSAKGHIPWPSVLLHGLSDFLCFLPSTLSKVLVTWFSTGTGCGRPLSRLLARSLVLAALLSGARASELNPFACCSGQDECGGVHNDPVVCDVLGDLYYSTGGSVWDDNAGWAAAASGEPTDYCGFVLSSCGGGMIVKLCVRAGAALGCGA